VSSEGLVAPGANAASLLGFHDVTGDSPFHLGEIDRLMERSPELVWWRLLNVTSVVTRRTFPAGAPVEPVAGGATATDDATNRGAAVYRVLVPAPFVWVPERVETLPPEWRPGPDFDPRKLGLVPGDTGAPDSGPAGSATMPGADALDGSAAPASLEGFGRFRIVVDATLPRQGIVVVSSAYAPGWRAQAVAADGTRSTPRVEPAYGALMAVALPPGQWRIRWTYLPGSVILGAVVTLLTLIAGAALWIRPRNPGR
jgi:hypothetical protein